MRVGVKPGQWGWTFGNLEASWRAAEEAGFGLVSCFDHVTAAPAGLAAWDAPSVLNAIAACTERVAVALDVVNSSLRHPFLLAGQIAVAQALSGGRVEVGLGAGSFHLARFDHGALGIPFPKLPQRLERLRECCEVLPQLWRGEEVTSERLGLREAALGPIGILPPPIVVGGQSEAVMQIAARYADGWNAVEPDPAAYAAKARRVDVLCEEVGRERPLMKTVQVFVRDVDLARARDLLPRFEEAGASSAVFVLTDDVGPAGVRELADALL